MNEKQLSLIGFLYLIRISMYSIVNIFYIVFDILFYRTHCLLVMSARNLCKQSGPRSGPTKCRAWSGSNLFDTQTEFLKEFFEKVDFEKNQQTVKNMKNFPGGKELIDVLH